MTLDEILQSAHRIYDGNTDYPTSGSDDYIYRKGVVNDLIDLWEREPILWQELIVLNQSISFNGSGVATLPSDFKKMVGYLSIDGTSYTYRKPSERKLLEAQKVPFYTIYGGNNLYVYPNPTNGTTTTIDYYKSATKLVNGSDEPEMSDPYYLVYGLVAKLYEQDNRSDKSVEYENKAVDILNKMIEDNEMPPVNFTETLDTTWSLE